MKQNISKDYSYSVIDLIFAGAVVDQEIELHGQRIQYLTGTLSLSIRLHSKNNDAIPLLRFQDINGPFEKFYISSSGAGSVTILVANPGTIHVGGAQVQVAEVTLLKQDDSWKYETDQARSFFGSAPKGASPGNYSYVQMWNPAASGVDVYIEKIELHGSAVNSLCFSSHNAALTTLNTKVSNKIIGGVAPQAELRDQYSAGMIGTRIVDIDYPLANVYSDLLKGSVAKVPPGVGLIIGDLIVNTAFWIQFEWVEIPV